MTRVKPERRPSRRGYNYLRTRNSNPRGAGQTAGGVMGWFNSGGVVGVDTRNSLRSDLIPIGAGAKITLDANGAVVREPKARASRGRPHPFTRATLRRVLPRRLAIAEARIAQKGADYFKSVTLPKWERMPKGAEG